LAVRVRPGINAAAIVAVAGAGAGVVVVVVVVVVVGVAVVVLVAVVVEVVAAVVVEGVVVEAGVVVVLGVAAVVVVLVVGAVEVDPGRVGGDVDAVVPATTAGVVVAGRAVGTGVSVPPTFGVFAGPDVFFGAAPAGAAGVISPTARARKQVPARTGSRGPRLGSISRTVPMSALCVAYLTTFREGEAIDSGGLRP
jgi:hypothetical protein